MRSALSGIHRLKQSMPKRKVGKMARSYDPIAPVAEEISEEACLLCFDEFQVIAHFTIYIFVGFVSSPLLVQVL